MKSDEIINEINTLLSDKKEEIKSKDDFIYHSLQFLLTIIKTPFIYLSNFLKKEVLKAIKKDIKLLLLIAFIVGALIVFFLVLWFSVAVLIGAYFHDQGYSLFSSVLFSILFQLGCILFVGLIAFIASKQLKSVKTIKKVSKTIKSKVKTSKQHKG